MLFGLTLAVAVMMLPRVQADDAAAVVSKATAPETSTDSLALPGPPSRLAISDEERSGLRKYDVSQIINAEMLYITVDGRHVLLRLLGVQTERNESRDFLVRLLDGEAVCIKYHPDPRKKMDRAGHAQAYVFRSSDGIFINHAVIAHGFAGLSSDLGPQAEELRNAYRSAREANIGLWNAGTIYLSRIPPPEWVASINAVRRHRDEMRKLSRDINEGVVDSYYAGRREGAYEAGIASMRPRSGNAGGNGKVLVKNDTEFQAKLRVTKAETFSKVLIVAAKSSRTFELPFDEYQVCYQLEGDGGGTYKGESFTVDFDPVVIEISPQSKKVDDPKPLSGREPTKP
jgi:hypothetical protein